MDLIDTIGITIVLLVYLAGAFITLLAVGPKRKKDRITFMIALLVYFGFIFIAGRFFPDTFTTFSNSLLVFGAPAFIVYLAHRYQERYERLKAEAELESGIKGTIKKLEDILRYIDSHSSENKILAEYSAGIKTTMESITDDLTSIQKRLIQ